MKMYYGIIFVHVLIISVLLFLKYFSAVEEFCNTSNIAYSYLPFVIAKSAKRLFINVK